MPHATSRSDSLGNTDSQGHGDILVGAPRICNEFQKVCIDSKIKFLGLMINSV